jgi:hypothetical protein
MWPILIPYSENTSRFFLGVIAGDILGLDKDGAGIAGELGGLPAMAIIDIAAAPVLPGAFLYPLTACTISILLNLAIHHLAI